MASGGGREPRLRGHAPLGRDVDLVADYDAFPPLGIFGGRVRGLRVRRTIGEVISVSSAMRYASVWRRIEAFLLDYLLISAYIVLLVSVSVGLGVSALGGALRAMFADPNRSELSAFLLLVAPVILYFALCECAPWQATWGKRRLGLRVVDRHGDRLGLPRSLARSALKFVPWELTHACIWRIPGWPFAPTAPGPIITAGLALVWVIIAANLVSMLVSQKHQALYDWIAGTTVIATSLARRSGGG